VKGISVTFMAISYLCCSMANANELPTFTSLCVPTASTGFNLVDGKWVKVNFAREQFFLKKVNKIPEQPSLPGLLRDASPESLEAYGRKRDEWILWGLKYEKCARATEKKAIVGEGFNVYYPCVLTKKVKDTNWAGYACDEWFYKQIYPGQTRFFCKGRTEITFLPDGNYLRITSHGDLFDSTKDAESQIMEMGRCSVITE